MQWCHDNMILGCRDMSVSSFFFFMYEYECRWNWVLIFDGKLGVAGGRTFVFVVWGIMLPYPGFPFPRK